MEEATRKRKWSFGEASDPVTEEKLKIIEKEVKEQETLIQGYHQVEIVYPSLPACLYLALPLSLTFCLSLPGTCPQLPA